MNSHKWTTYSGPPACLTTAAHWRALVWACLLIAVVCAAAGWWGGHETATMQGRAKFGAMRAAWESALFAEQRQAAADHNAAEKMYGEWKACENFKKDYKGG